MNFRFINFIVGLGVLHAYLWLIAVHMLDVMPDYTYFTSNIMYYL